MSDYQEITVNVTDTDIKSGIKSDRASCPIALAFNRMLKPGFFCMVVDSEISVYNDNNSCVELIELDPDVSAFIYGFDSGGIVRGDFEFELNSNMMHFEPDFNRFIKGG